MAFTTTTTIIVAVCAGVVGIVVLSVAIYVARRRSRRAHQRPLPPPQPLAHHRERQVSNYLDQRPTVGVSLSGSRASSWYDAAHVSANTVAPTTASNSSLFPPSNGTCEKPHQLFPPSPSFHSHTPHPSRSPSSSSLGSSAEGYGADTPSSLGSATSSTQPLMNSPRHSRRMPSHLRRPSMSSVSTGRNTISGAPHGPHSSVNIILPAPLAPQLNPYTRSASATSTYRTSVVDAWASTRVQSVVIPEEREGRERRRRSTSTPALSRRSNSSRSSSLHNMDRTPSTSSSHSRRRSTLAASQSLHNAPPLPHSNSASSKTSSSKEPPPVPRIPSRYIAEGEMEERGRTHGHSTSLSLSNPAAMPSKRKDPHLPQT
ncbi:hypothetical protein PLICRDRAFT_26664 [Plicaturopsis crispa FD-325 SS-3]|nr:hypothetical protein PLICRDRAFT_26664 [Plicaturopsis crispa FD-325 SS-3]